MSTSIAGGRAPDATVTTAASGRVANKARAAADYEHTAAEMAAAAVGNAREKVKRANNHLKGTEDALANAVKDEKAAKQRAQQAHAAIGD